MGSTCLAQSGENKVMIDAPMPQMTVTHILDYGNVGKILLNQDGREIARYNICNGSSSGYCFHLKGDAFRYYLNVHENKKTSFFLTGATQRGPFTISLNPQRVVAFKVPRLGTFVQLGRQQSWRKNYNSPR